MLFIHKRNHPRDVQKAGKVRTAVFFCSVVLPSLFLCSCPDPLPEGISLTPNKLSIEVKETYAIRADIQPANSGVDKLSWQSSNPEVASVDQQGRVTGLSPGQAEIIATLTEFTDIRAVCQVSVRPSQSKINIELSRNTICSADNPPEMISWYYLTAAAGSSYRLEWQAAGSGGYTADVLISAYHADKVTPYFENEKVSPREITVSACERVYIKVEQLQTGTYTLKYNLENSGIPATWTLMFYLNCNDMESAVADNIRDMLEGMHPQLGMNLVILLDKASGADYNMPGFSFSGTRMFCLGEEGLSRMGGLPEFPDITCDGEDELNLGDAEILGRFIDYAKNNFPATRYALIFMGHGLGAGGFSADDLTGDRLHPGEISFCLPASCSVDLLGFNSCLMGNAETAYQFRDDVSNTRFKADYMLAPPSVTREIGWAYAPVFARINSAKGGSSNGEEETVTGGTELIYNPALMTADELGLLFVEEHMDFMFAYGLDYGNADSLVLYDLGAATAVKESCDELALSLYSENEKAAAEALRDNPKLMTAYFRREVSADELAKEKTFYPYYDLMGFCKSISADTENFSDDTRTAAAELITDIEDMILLAYWGSYTGNDYGLSFFFPSGDGLYRDAPMFTYQWWYNAGRVSRLTDENYFGALVWCADKASDRAGQVDNWFELLDAWYDTGGNAADGGVNDYQY